ncbi:hypothetical protein [Okeania sp. SIO1I7]|uniref:hypothetical protein n=1 Tax=Okeania sp. SIO1I7 TaxID=2607772 RepID=UPI0013F8E191|nr:hypothetical protein [Okeania sp. SIO1I7]NET26151.1 hypothetical protein [Okeania sp. SIO1I7]
MFANVANGNFLKLPGIELEDQAESQAEGQPEDESVKPVAVESQPEGQPAKPVPARYYQILIVTEENQNESFTDFELGLRKTVYIGTKDELKKQFSNCRLHTENGLLTDRIDKLPYSGINMEQIFPNRNNFQSFREVQGQYTMVRRLFQARKLSQLIAKSWLNVDAVNAQQEDKNEEFLTQEENVRRLRVIRKLFLTGNQVLDSSEQVKFFNRNNWINLKKEPYVIRPEQENWQSICLNLLFCGQAYLEYKHQNQKKYIPLWVPILSTYEASCFYAFSINSDTFTGTIEERQKIGTANPPPPYYTASIPYPPRPHTGSEFDLLRDSMIKKWAYAKDVELTAKDAHPSNEELSFCEKAWDDKDGINIKFVVPPYPYLPMSCCC